jgi:hypothetical protein
VAKQFFPPEFVADPLSRKPLARPNRSPETEIPPSRSALLFACRKSPSDKTRKPSVE